jgi:hypothetical protein
MINNRLVLSDSKRKIFTWVFWVFALFPFLIVASLLLFQSEDDLPPVSMLDNPPELQASLILGQGCRFNTWINFSFVAPLYS